MSVTTEPKTDTFTSYNVMFVCNYCVVVTTVDVEGESDPVAVAAQLLLDDMGLDIASMANDIEVESLGGE